MLANWLIMRSLCSLLSYMLFFIVLSSCQEKQQKEVTPWGTEIGGDSVSSNEVYDLSDIVNNGEIITLTLSGPETYYDYRGRGMGLQYLLCEKFAQSLGVSLRVEVCKDTSEMVSRLKKGDADIIAFQLPTSTKGVAFAGVNDKSKKTSWAVQQKNSELAEALNKWFKPTIIAEVRELEDFYLSTRSIKRHVYSPMLNRSGGVISRYDKYFQQYAPLARWDWRLMAAQCYQESTFDPQARSWVGASGLMQIMPSTAQHLGLPQSQIFDPENNIAAAAKYIKELDGHFRDIPASERVYFVLASYNGGHFHVRDAMALAKKHGRNANRWSEVQEFVLKLSNPAYYNDPVVRYGYMRGNETVDYVSRINARWGQYCGVARGGFIGSPVGPERSKRGNRWQI